MRRFVLLLALALPAHAETCGSWESGVYTDPITDASRAYAQVFLEDAVIGFRCEDATTTAVLLKTTRYVLPGPKRGAYFAVPADFRVDDLPPRRFYLSRVGQVWMAIVPDVKELLAEVRTGSSLVVRLNGSNGSQDFRFPLDGAGECLSGLACSPPPAAAP